MWLSDYIGKPLQLHTFLKDMSSWMAFGSGRTSFLIEVKPRDESSSKSRHSRAGPWLRLRNVWHAGINDYEHLATLGVSPNRFHDFSLDFWDVSGFIDFEISDDLPRFCLLMLLRNLMKMFLEAITLKIQIFFRCEWSKEWSYGWARDV